MVGNIGSSYFYNRRCDCGYNRRFGNWRHYSYYDAPYYSYEYGYYLRSGMRTWADMTPYNRHADVPFRSYRNSYTSWLCDTNPNFRYYNLSGEFPVAVYSDSSSYYQHADLGLSFYKMASMQNELAGMVTEGSLRGFQSQSKGLVAMFNRMLETETLCAMAGGDSAKAAALKAEIEGYLREIQALDDKMLRASTRPNRAGEYDGKQFKDLGDPAVGTAIRSVLEELKDIFQRESCHDNCHFARVDALQKALDAVLAGEAVNLDIDPTGFEGASLGAGAGLGAGAQGAGTGLGAGAQGAGTMTNVGGNPATAPVMSETEYNNLHTTRRENLFGDVTTNLLNEIKGNTNITIENTGTGAAIRTADGHKVDFRQKADGTYQIWVTGDSSGDIIYEYNASGNLTKIRVNTSLPGFENVEITTEMREKANELFRLFRPGSVAGTTTSASNSNIVPGVYDYELPADETYPEARAQENRNIVEANRIIGEIMSANVSDLRVEQYAENGKEGKRFSLSDGRSMEILKWVDQAGQDRVDIVVKNNAGVLLTYGLKNGSATQVVFNDIDKPEGVDDPNAVNGKIKRSADISANSKARTLCNNILGWYETAYNNVEVAARSVTEVEAYEDPIRGSIIAPTFTTYGSSHLAVLHIPGTALVINKQLTEAQYKCAQGYSYECSDVEKTQAKVMRELQGQLDEAIRNWGIKDQSGNPVQYTVVPSIPSDLQQNKVKLSNPLDKSQTLTCQVAIRVSQNWFDRGECIITACTPDGKVYEAVYVRSDSSESNPDRARHALELLAPKLSADGWTDVIFYSQAWGFAAEYKGGEFVPTGQSVNYQPTIAVVN